MVGLQAWMEINPIQQVQAVCYVPDTAEVILFYIPGEA